VIKSSRIRILFGIVVLLIVLPPALFAQDSEKAVEPADSSEMVTVFYFHTNQRCANCIKFENWSKQVINTDFAEALDSGRLLYRMVNVSEKKNAHYIQDYRLVSKSLVLSRKNGDKEETWKNLDQIWMLVRDQRKFKAYIKNEIEAMLHGDRP
jgi:hypothetical protein